MKMNIEGDFQIWISVPLRYSSFCPDVIGHVGKRLDKKAKNAFKIYGVTDWITNNCRTLIAHYLKKLSQLDNEIWSVYRM